MGGDGGQVLGYDVGEGVKRGPRALLATFIFISHSIADEEKRARTMRFYVVKWTARLPWWERLYAVDLVLQRCEGTCKLSEPLPGLF